MGPADQQRYPVPKHRSACLAAADQYFRAHRLLARLKPTWGPVLYGDEFRTSRNDRRSSVGPTVLICWKDPLKYKSTLGESRIWLNPLHYGGLGSLHNFTDDLDVWSDLKKQFQALHDDVVVVDNYNPDLHQTGTVAPRACPQRNIICIT